ncbi:molybdenum cofactor biosynthesis protein MoaE [Rhodocaloribacter litoris]|uniref:molybdenum cofactor biosynthesis protein MoaE n=1 Tax=Rhodocaloribacter litoris TaxID=2558931 RepID=UPI00142281C5|nr:molybdenum cofactor biosynthesis protein MoaE [Rhodocaloribacter litoris]QXD15975.1 molybdenum cofactor biosynthesis protein MoaE [Rhodocaloribacter litoris]
MQEIKNETQWIRLQSDPLDVSAATDYLRVPGAGGIDLFLGITRRWSGPATGDPSGARRETVRLSYECFVPMAMQEMQRLAAAAAARWPVERVCLWHRLGVVPVAEASVLIGVATPHRAEAFAACRFLIDTLKRQVPIWKREHFADGRTVWVQGDAPPELPPVQARSTGEA